MINDVYIKWRNNMDTNVFHSTPLKNITLPKPRKRKMCKASARHFWYPWKPPETLKNCPDAPKDPLVKRGKKYKDHNVSVSASWDLSIIHRSPKDFQRPRKTLQVSTWKKNAQSLSKTFNDWLQSLWAFRIAQRLSNITPPTPKDPFVKRGKKNTTFLILHLQICIISIEAPKTFKDP